jgi:YggT family protein
MDLIGDILLLLIRLYVWVIIAYVVVSWLLAFDILNTRNMQARKIVAFLNKLVEPALKPIRKIIPSIAGIDISPIILIIGLQILQMVIFRVFY